MTTSTVITFSPKSLCLHILSWPHCPSYLGVICDPCLSLGFPSKCPASPGVLTVFPGNGSHLSLHVSCYCCPCSGLCASFQMDSSHPVHCMRFPPPALPSSLLHLFRPWVTPMSLSGSVYRASCSLDEFITFHLWRGRVSELFGGRS